MANGSQTPKIEAAATTAMVDAVQELTAQCALEECCVLVSSMPIVHRNTQWFQVWVAD